MITLFVLQEAEMVLGGDDGDECTYLKGYLKRQAIFSCLTCTPEGNAGVCTACSLSCHEGHEVILSCLEWGKKYLHFQLYLFYDFYVTHFWAICDVKELWQG